MSEIIENVGGEYGATVRFKVHENGALVDFFAASIESLGKAADQTEFHPEYEQKDDDSHATQSFETAVRYAEGFVKWDGCSHVEFGDDEDRYIHLCGKSDFDKLATVLAAIYARCGELMRAAGTELLAGEF